MGTVHVLDERRVVLLPHRGGEADTTDSLAETERLWMRHVSPTSASCRNVGRQQLGEQ